MLNAETYNPSLQSVEASFIQKRRRPLEALAFALAALACAPASDIAYAASATLDASLGSVSVSSDLASQAPGGNAARDEDDFSAGQASVLRIDADAKAEQLFQSDFVSARATTLLARDNQAVSGLSDGVLAGLSQTSQPVDLRGKGLSLTISALQNVSPSIRSARLSPATLDFWNETATDEIDVTYEGVTAEFSTRNRVERPNVLIPLPAAAWSGLTVLGGVSLLAGARKIRRRFL